MVKATYQIYFCCWNVHLKPILKHSVPYKICWLTVKTFVNLQAAKSCNCWNSAGDSFSHVRLWLAAEASTVLVEDEDGALDSVMLSMEATVLHSTQSIHCTLLTICFMYCQIPQDVLHQGKYRGWNGSTVEISCWAVLVWLLLEYKTVQKTCAVMSFSLFSSNFK